MTSPHDLVTRGLRLIDPETAHHAALLGLRAQLGPRARADRWPRLNTNLAGLELPNPIGMAAGFDKNCEAPDALLRSGFGFVECGTVTPLPQAGNPKPRIFRLSEDRAVINRLGFNNKGLDAFADRLAARAGRPGIVGANVGANKESADRTADYVLGMGRVWKPASYVTANISSPNTPGLRGLQERGALEELLGRLREARAPLTVAHGRRPLFLKVAPDLDDAAIEDIAEIALSYELDALIVSNTTLQRPPHLTSDNREEQGGLSGQPLFQISTQTLRTFAQVLNGRLPLIGVGGVENGMTAFAKIKAGASAVQLYSAMVFQGPSLVARILDELDGLLMAEGFDHISEAVGVERS
ncbi:quinone-dependent dihydroorotate dehydrogenase [Candidatus Viadribacter manganicus]|uniref:Dihydroorotate dehydrogenase (quinone) n=1 Tax=Candidatus Viadribacter manganicus TaxID=1759059 RepID=A0A1B1AFR5_9PROT|nr:quinone-dependent dihydroorotate dehydrogenase [Candidatus Viadribacter manganicus]ANP45398.1 dihydroorotate dehydrogenase 2 [Candidatus Viadribacter manganicus]